MPPPFNDAAFDKVLAHMRNGDDMFAATEREGYYVRDLFDYIAARRAAGHADLHPLLYLARADWLEVRAGEVTVRMSERVRDGLVRVPSVAEVERQAAVRLLDEARGLRRTAEWTMPV